MLRFVALLAVPALLATAAFPQGELADLHLDVVSRTPEEAARIDAVTQPTASFASAEQYEARSAGAATVRAKSNRDAFSEPSGNISFERELDFLVGNGLFRKIWVSAPSSTLASDGLGPLFNARSCQRCHIKDGRGHPPATQNDNAISMIMKLSIPPEDGTGGARPEPTYGWQLHDFSLPGIPAEAKLGVTYSEIEVPLSEGETAYLRAPVYSALNPGYGPLHPDTMLSPRVAPQMIGLGLLEAIPASDILSRADPDDTNGDGISGRPNVSRSVEFGQSMLGRFGHKAAAPTIKEQTANAFNADIGISSPLKPVPWGDCTEAQASCRGALHGDQDGRKFEIDQEGLDLVTFYSRNLAVPARRDVSDPQVLAGKKVFYETGCILCHAPKFVTHRLQESPEQSFQLIWPYTDLLLHDMGEGLADDRPEGRATGSEWRTAPLWGIGLTELVSEHTQFLHDGRARNLLEAILWHGGEAAAQRDAVVSMSKSDRDALIRFLESL